MRRALKVLLIGVAVSETLAFAPPLSRHCCHCQHHSHHTNRQQVILWEQNSKVSSQADFVTTVIDTPTDVEDDDDKTYALAFRNTILSILVAVLFGAGLWVTAGPVVGEEYFAGYIVEKSLSVDNLFVFLLLFDYFKVPTQYQGRILSWGIYGSVVMRAIMIGLGAAALQHFRGILLVFAGILIYSAIQVLEDVEEELVEKENDIRDNPVVKFSKFLCESNEECSVDDLSDEELNNPVVMLSRNIFPSTNQYDGDRFFTIENGVKKATPLFVCMVAVELSDVVFAVDSIPAVFGVTEVSSFLVAELASELIVVESNVMAPARLC
jgi:predicted tellurium resistance membrane protein TerC